MINVSIIGATGYSGAELLKILARHKNVKIDKLFANTTAGKKLADVIPSFKNQFDITIEKFSVDALANTDIVFIALPSGEALTLVPEILKAGNPAKKTAGKRIIDLGGDYRLQDTALYEKYYKRVHTALNELKNAVYGLPEWNTEKIKSAQFVSNPGCYPTSAILPLLPLLKEKVIETERIVINSLSGVSGAGKSSSIEMSFAEVNESVRAYKVGIHQHLPEINSMLKYFSGEKASVSFTPHLLPITRGIYTTTNAKLVKQISEQEVLAIYEKYYGKSPFVRFSATDIPEIKNVNYTNFIDIGFRVNNDEKQITVLSSIDNLIKGAAGQAIQNMNIMFGFDETEGLK